MYNEKLLISVIIPVYNAEQYIERCLNSIVHNTYRNLEIICINDGSTDTSFEKLHSPSVLVMIPYNLFRGMSLYYVKGSEKYS